MSLLLGLADLKISDRHDVSWQTNKIGGKPDWYGLCDIKPSCPVCCRHMSLVVQLYCPLENSDYHRTLYVFGCTSPSCWNTSDSWLIYRCQRLDKPQDAVPIKKPIDDWGASRDNWGMDANDWGTDADNVYGEEDWGIDSDDVCEERDLEKDLNDVCVQGNDTRATPSNNELFNNNSTGSKIEIADPVNPAGDLDLPVHQLSIAAEDIDDDDTTQEYSHVIQEELPVLDKPSEILKSLQTNSCVAEHTDNELTSYFLNVIEEPANQSHDDRHVTKLLVEYQKREGCSIEEIVSELCPASSGGATEKYEKTALVHKDKMFHKFRKVIAYCPEQCVRYQLNGSPLYIRQPCDDLSARCEHCHGELVFELQLMPTLVNYLQVPNNPCPALEFGCVYIFSCKQSCWSDTDIYRQEKVLVQTDPDQHLFK